MAKFLVVALAGVLCLTTAAEIQFGSNTWLEPVDESTLSPEDQTAHADVKNTGAFLFDSTGLDDARLSTNVPVSAFISSASKYFRAHPAHISCLQKVFNHIQNEHGRQIVIQSAFRTSSDSEGHTQGYDQSGTAAVLKYKDGRTGADILDIAVGVVKGCPTFFARENRDVGLVLTEDAAHIFMTGADDLTPHLESLNANMPNASFPTWYQDTLNAALDPRRFPTCDEYSSLAPDEIYPSWVDTVEEAVGVVDSEVTRATVEDFSRLMQYPGTNIEFEDGEGSSTWCGEEGNACVPCASGMVGQALASRCADRTMSPRLYRSLNVLQKLIREATNDGDRLTVLDAWHEPHSADETGAGLDALHREGRAARLVLGNNPSDLTGLSKLAVCAGFDFIQIQGAHLFVAVRKQAELRSQDISFTNAILTAVTPPNNQKSSYQLPAEFSRSLSEFPVFDTNNMDDVPLTDNARLGMFKSKTARYMRIAPVVATCFDALHRQEWKWVREEDKATAPTVKVVKGFQTNEELGDMRYDPRGLSQLQGRAMLVSYTSDTFSDHEEKYSVDRLVKSAVDACSIPMHRRGFSMGIGIYEEGLYIDAREQFDLWTEDAALIPGNSTDEEYKDAIAERRQFALENRVINPSSPLDICAREVPPQRQNPYFVFEHEHSVKRKRKRRAAGQADESCNPVRNTPFCIETKPHRETEISHVWTEVMRKHLWHDETEVRDALDGCLGDCGTCAMGHIYEDKLEHCSNFAHWAPFDLMNDAPDVTHFYSRSNDEARIQACHGARQCVSKAPLYALLSPSLETLYRPDPQRSVQEELYSSTDNPMPVYPIIHRMFSMHAKGEVTLWVDSPAEIRELYHPLRVIFIFNREVTHVTVYVRDEGKFSGVDQAIQTMLEEWVSSACPLNSRAMTTPFTITKWPEGIVKRSADNDFGEMLLERRRHFDQYWLKSSGLL